MSLQAITVNTVISVKESTKLNRSICCFTDAIVFCFVFSVLFFARQFQTDQRGRFVLQYVENLCLQDYSFLIPHRLACVFYYFSWWLSLAKRPQLSYHCKMILFKIFEGKSKKGKIKKRVFCVFTLKKSPVKNHREFFLGDSKMFNSIRFWSCFLHLKRRRFFFAVDF